MPAKVPNLIRAKYPAIERSVSAILVLAAVWLWGTSYLAGRSLFLDEANLALNIAERNFGAFFQPLRYEQYAPPLFLVLVKLACEAVGYSVWGLRLVPLLAGMGTLWLAWRLPTRLGWTAYRPLLLGLVVANEYTLRYFTECKQYGWDLFIALGLVYLALAQPPRLSWPRAIGWAALGGVVVWASMPSVFVLAGIGLRELWRHRHAPDRAAAGRWLAVGACWLGSFLVYYLLILRADSLRPALADWHRPYFFPLLPQSEADLRRLFTLLHSLIHTAYGHTVYAQAIATLSGLAGVWAIVKDRHALGPLALLPVGGAILASGLGQYSLIPRLVLFALPLLWLVSLYGTRHLARNIGRHGPGIVLLIWLPALLGTRNEQAFVSPPRYDETRELLAAIPPGDTDEVYTSQFAAPATRYYRTWAPGRMNLALANPPPRIHYGTSDQSALNQLLTERPDSAFLLYSHPNPDLARQYQLTARRKLTRAGYAVEPIDERYNGWVLRARR